MIQISRAPKPQVLLDNAETWTTEYLKARNNYTNNPSAQLKRSMKG
jgi:hypothetical protein